MSTKSFFPGDPERNTANGRDVSGIPLDAANWEKLTDLASELSVQVPESLSAD